MNIAFVVNSLTNGGAERCVANLANQMSLQKCNNIYVITGKRNDLEYELNKSVNRLCNIEYKHFFKDFFHIRKIARKFKIDVFIAFDVYPNALLCMTNILFKPKVIISERNSPNSVRISKLARLVRFIFYRKADGYVFQTQEAKEFYSKKIQRKSVIIHNPIKENLPVRLANSKKENVAVGRLVPQKNYKLLIDVFKDIHIIYPDYKLKIFGQGPLLSDLEIYVKEKKLSNFVYFEGFCPDVHEQIKNSDVFVMTSDFEGMPNSLMEAMAMGFPVISTDCPAGGPKELINGMNGLLVPVGNSKAFFDALVKVLQDTEFKNSLGNAARKVIETHSVEFITEQWMLYIKNILKRK